MTSATIKLFLPRGDAKSLGTAEIYPYAVAQRKLTKSKVKEFLPQVVAEIPWDHRRRRRKAEVRT
jgi:hypothetical protein